MPSSTTTTTTIPNVLEKLLSSLTLPKEGIQLFALDFNVCEFFFSS